MNDKTLLTRQLRTGNTFIEIRAEKAGTFSVNAKQTEFLLKEDHVVFKTTLTPKGSNEIEDTEKTFIENTNILNKVTFNDLQIKKEAGKFFQAHKSKVNFNPIKFEVIYKKVHKFNASLAPTEDGVTISIIT